MVRAYSWIPETRDVRALGAITDDELGETTQDEWVAYSNGAQIAFPPSLRFCGEGTVIACSLANVQPGSVYDVARSGSRVLATPVSGPRTVVDATAFAGRALIAWIYDGSRSRGEAWDVASGRRVALPDAPERVLAATWTDNGVVAIGARAAGPGLVVLRLGGV